MATTYYVDPENGDEGNDGLTTASPWRLIPGQSGSHTIANGDTINIKNGTVSTGGVITVPNNSLTYQGYGVASNVLILNLPADDVSQLLPTKAVRTAGSHEGMWTLDLRGVTSFAGISIPNARSGTTITDFTILSTDTLQVGVSCGVSSATSATSIAVLKRFYIFGPNVGVTAYKHNITLQYGKISNTAQDNVTFGATATNSYRAGSVDKIEFCEFKYPNTDVNGNDQGKNGFGDCFQMYHEAGRIESSLLIKDCTFFKKDMSKQIMLLMDGTGGITIKRFHIKSESPIAQTGVLLANIRGTINIEKGFFGGGNTLPVIRVRSSSTVPAQILTTAAVINIKHITVTGENLTTFFDLADDNATEVDGTVNIYNCTFSGTQDQTVTRQGTIFLEDSPSSYGANFNITVKNCVFNQDIRHVSLATTGVNDSSWVFTKNYFRPNVGFKLGATEYTTLTEFEAGHSAATSNIASGTTYLNGNNVITNSNSSLISAGSHLGYVLDASSKVMYNPPSLGAFEYRRER